MNDWSIFLITVADGEGGRTVRCAVDADIV
jgi:hypothetical protein